MAGYKVEFSKQAADFLCKLDNSMQLRILSVLDRIKIRPQDFVEKLVGEPGYKLRVGDYRLFLDIENEKLMIFVIEISHRKNAYKK